MNDAIIANRPQNRFNEIDLGTFTSTSQIDTLLNKFTHANSYRTTDSFYTSPNGTQIDQLATGMYFTLQDGTYNGVWMIADFDNYYHVGDTLSGYGISIIPRNYITTSYMNSTHTTEGGYYNSYMNQTVIPQIESAMTNILGSHLQTRRVLLSNSVDMSAVAPGYTGWTGCANNWAWYSQKATLMSEVQLYGSRVWGGGFDMGEAPEKLSVFNFIEPSSYDATFWLRGVASSAHFCFSNWGGIAAYHNAGLSYGVRPLLYLA